MNLLSNELKQMFEQKISTEIYNSNFYLKVSNYLSILGLNKIAEYFKKQSLEELTHRDLFMDFASDRDCPINMIQVDGIFETFTTLKEIGILFLERERITSKYITDMAFRAFEEEDLISYDFLLQMIRLQRAEEEEANTFLNQTTNIGDEVEEWQEYNNTFSL